MFLQRWSRRRVEEALHRSTYAKKPTSAADSAATVGQDAVDYTKRSKQGRTSRVVPAEVIEASGRKGDLQKTYAEKETSAASINTTVRHEDAVDYPKMVRKGQLPRAAPAEVLLESVRESNS